MRPPRPGSSQCGAVQQALQLGIGDYNKTKFGTREQWLKLLSASAGKASQAKLITPACSQCIVSQFQAKVPVAQQVSCGTIVPPTAACSRAAASSEKVTAASTLALATGPAAMADGASFADVIQLTQNILNCQIIASAEEEAAEEAEGSGKATSKCAVGGVNYCGPGNTGDPSNSWGQYLPSVPACLNEQCCLHDNCYSEDCVPASCRFDSSATSSCDAPLLAACQGTGGCSSSVLLNPSALFVCSVVSCLTEATDPTCSFIQAVNSATSTCDGPCTDSSCCPAGTTCITGSTTVPGAITGVCCPANNFPRESTCCPSDQMCSDGQCVTACPSGTLACGTICCSPDQACTNGQCGCPAGSSLCGTSCALKGNARAACVVAARLDLAFVVITVALMDNFRAGCVMSAPRVRRALFAAG